MFARRAVSIACVAGLGLGCQSQRATLATAAVSGGVSFAATYVIGTREDAPVPVLLTATAITSGALALGALLAGLDHDGGERPRTVQTIRMPDRREEAWDLTQRAAAAARAGACDEVRRYRKIVLEVDASFHDKVFARDAAIARCIAASAEAPPTAAEVLPPAAGPAGAPLTPAR